MVIVAARCHQRVNPEPRRSGYPCRGSDDKFAPYRRPPLVRRVYSSQGAAVPLGGDEGVTLHRSGISVAQNQVEG